MVRIVILSLLVLLSLPSLAVNKVVATVDKNPVMANESFILTVTADDDVDADQLDTSALMRDFVVGNTSVSRQTQMVNFKTSRETRWTTLLIAKKTGKFIIPAFDIQGKKTSPIAIAVTKSAAKGDKARELFIESNISSTHVYVQQQLTLTVKLFFSKDLKRGSLSEPEMLDANIKQVGKDVENVEVINGVRYRVIERNSAISPQKSGEFLIAAPVFTGEVLNQNRRSVFSSFSQSKPVSVVAMIWD